MKFDCGDQIDLVEQVPGGIGIGQEMAAAGVDQQRMLQSAVVLCGRRLREGLQMQTAPLDSIERCKVDVVVFGRDPDSDPS